MKIPHLLILFLFLTAFVSCSKDSLEGTYTYTQLSEEKDYYGFTKVNGEITAILTTDIDPSIFNNANTAYPIDNITILDNENLSYDANDIWSSNPEVRNEQSTYEYENDQLTMKFYDEFGNDDNFIFVVGEEQIDLTMLATVTVKDGILQPLEKNNETPNFGYSPENARYKLEIENIEKIYVMYYKQVYKL